MSRESITTPEGVTVRSGLSAGLYLRDDDRFRYVSPMELSAILDGQDLLRL